MHRRKNYRKSVMTKLPASVGIATTGDVGMTGANRCVTTAAILVVVAVVQDAVNSARSVEPVVEEEIASVVSAVVGDVTGIAIPDHANCRSRRRACA
ncbi:MAG: hypothetical protein B9S38_14040 [Verrucomicrobiia bacterium Tous-C4TDCM]|nr:MAG: hypothetical protein B9S38_14040 [Verrucomicrobiae bacterium Tous-C4TDCM]